MFIYAPCLHFVKIKGNSEAEISGEESRTKNQTINFIDLFY